MPNLTQSALVSILINNYNYGQFIADAIRSALAQSYAPIEIVVVDDGSTDNSRTIIESFGTRIKAVFKSNAGQASAYNAGVKACHGEFIHFLDSDDILAPSAIQEAIKLWSPGVAKIHFYLRVVEGPEAKSTHALMPAAELANGDIRNQLATTGCYISPPASGNLYWRPVIDRLFPMPEQDWITGADTYPIFLSALFGEVRACRKILGSYRVHGSNRDAQTRVTPKLLRYRLTKELHRDELLSEFCPMAGLTYQPGSVANDLAHMKVRLSSLALSSDGHPYPDDHILHLARRAASLCWHRKEWSVSKKLVFTLWIGYMTFAPAAWLPLAIDLAFVPTRRLRSIQKMMSKGVNDNAPAEPANREITKHATT